MGIRRKFMSASSFGLIPFRSNGDKLAKMEKQNQRAEKGNAKKDRNLQEQILAEQRRANDLKERELALQHPEMEDPPTDEERRAAFPSTPLKPGNSWWGYSNPGKKPRRG
jgi:hypothetical protein